MDSMNTGNEENMSFDQCNDKLVHTSGSRQKMIQTDSKNIVDRRKSFNSKNDTVNKDKDVK